MSLAVFALFARLNRDHRTFPGEKQRARRAGDLIGQARGELSAQLSPRPGHLPKDVSIVEKQIFQVREHRFARTRAALTAHENPPAQNAPRLTINPFPSVITLRECRAEYRLQVRQLGEFRARAFPSQVRA